MKNGDVRELSGVLLDITIEVKRKMDGARGGSVDGRHGGPSLEPLLRPGWGSILATPSASDSL